MGVAAPRAPFGGWGPGPPQILNFCEKILEFGRQIFFEALIKNPYLK